MHDDLRTQLETISEQLGDRIMSVLREALDEGAAGRPAEEKLLTRARGAVDRAIVFLDRIEG